MCNGTHGLTVYNTEYTLEYMHSTTREKELDKKRVKEDVSHVINSTLSESISPRRSSIAPQGSHAGRQASSRTVH